MFLNYYMDLRINSQTMFKYLFCIKTNDKNALAGDTKCIYLYLNPTKIYFYK